MTYFGLLHVILVNHDHLNILDYVCITYSEKVVRKMYKFHNLAKRENRVYVYIWHSNHTNRFEILNQVWRSKGK